MKTQEAAHVIEALIRGANPSTGEELRENAVPLDGPVLRALYLALRALESHLPVTAGVPFDKAAGDECGSTQTLAQAAAECGIVVTKDTQARFRRQGWFFVGVTLTRCATCGTRHLAFRCPYTTSAGLTYHYWGLVCRKCRTAVAPAKLDRDERAKLYSSSRHRPLPRKSA